MAPSNRSFVVFFLSTALVLRPAANSRECLLESKNERICIKHSRQGSTNGPTKSTGTNKSNWETPWILFHTHIITILFVQHHRIFPLCPVVFRSSVRRGKRRYGVCRMGKGRILTASRGANLTTTSGKIHYRHYMS